MTASGWWSQLSSRKHRCHRWGLGLIPYVAEVEVYSSVKDPLCSTCFVMVPTLNEELIIKLQEYLGLG